MDFKELNNRVKMPVQGFGVFQIPDATECEKVVTDALAVGYRLIDTASVYGNERAVGTAIRKAAFRVKNCSSRPKHGFRKWVTNRHCRHSRLRSPVWGWITSISISSTCLSVIITAHGGLWKNSMLKDVYGLSECAISNRTDCWIYAIIPELFRR